MKTLSKDGIALTTGGYADHNTKSRALVALASGKTPATVSREQEIHIHTIKKWALEVRTNT